MDGTDFLIASTVLVAALVLFVVFTRPREKNASPQQKPRQTTRWRRYRVQVSGLYRKDASPVIKCEDPDGIELPMIAGSIDRLPILLGGDPRNALVKIERPRMSMRAVLKLRVESTSWLKLKPVADDDFPDLIGSDAKLPRNLPAADDLELVGDLAEREYEIRAGGRLVASVSWQRDERGSPATKGFYTLEITRSAVQMPIIALVLALEVSTSIEGNRVELRKAEETT
jgi:hypothetical protein